jgi:hypothetical protein
MPRAHSDADADGREDMTTKLRTGGQRGCRFEADGVPYNHVPHVEQVPRLYEGVIEFPKRP